MTDIPVLFQPEMITGIDQGHKTMTRRLAWRGRKAADGDGFYPSSWQKIKAGDRLWVRERHWRWGRWVNSAKGGLTFEAVPATLGDVFFGEKPPGAERAIGQSIAWYKRPSIFMPKNLSRFTLIVTEVKMEPLQNISDADALKEGVIEEGNLPGIFHIRGGWKMGVAPNDRPSKVFRDLWLAIHGKKSWDTNPQVVAVSFRTIKANIDTVSPPSKTHTGRLAQSA